MEFPDISVNMPEISQVAISNLWGPVVVGMAHHAVGLPPSRSKATVYFAAASAEAAPEAPGSCVRGWKSTSGGRCSFSLCRLRWISEFRCVFAPDHQHIWLINWISLDEHLWQVETLNLNWVAQFVLPVQRLKTFSGYTWYLFAAVFCLVTLVRQQATQSRVLWWRVVPSILFITFETQDGSWTYFLADNWKPKRSMQQAQSLKISELSTIHLAMNSSLASRLLDISDKKYVQDGMLSMSFLRTFCIV